MKKTLLFIFTFPLFVFSQSKELIRADKAFALEHYVESIKLFENLVDKGVDKPEVYQKLGDANYLNANYVQAYKWYLKLSGLNYQMDAEHQYRFAQTLKSVGLNEESNKEMALFAKKYPNEIRTDQYKKGFNDKTKLLFSNVSSLAFNSKYSDYGTAIKGDTIIFASSRNFVLDNTTYARTNQAFTSLFQTVKLSSGEYTSPKLFSKSSFSIYHEATPVFTKNGKTMYYSQNRFSKKSKTKLVNGLYKIYKSVYTNGKWHNEGPISFGENDSIRIADPALSPDGKYLYFAADFKESFGKSDLFKVAIHSDGTFGEVEHLSNKINSEGRESFPFITEDNTLIFASDGYPGFGGLDLYSIDLSDPNAVVTNLGANVNSPYDDFSLVTNSDMNLGYFSSNRPGGIGDDDVYTFELAYLPISMSGIVLDEITNEIIPNATVIVLDETGNIVATLQSDLNGKFALNNLKRDSKYTLKIQQIDNSIVERTVNTYKKDINETILIKKVVPEPQIDFESLLNSNIIYFDTDKFFIRKDAKLELDKVVAILNQYPQINIEIGSHTDSRESKKYNLRLSQQRANATLEYLVLKGIDRARLTAQGYGESQLVNDCKDGVKCSNAEHQKNRRSVFKLTN
jgi:outer membrane protein OmpA-like peptidoglycan-associated protein